MAAERPLPSPSQSAPEQLAAGDAETKSSQALVPVSTASLEPVSPEPIGGQLALLPVELDVAVPVRDFRVRNLLALEPGQVIESRWANGEDVPLASGAVQLAWSEFEVVDTELSVRVTRLA